MKDNKSELEPISPDSQLLKPSYPQTTNRSYPAPQSDRHRQDDRSSLYELLRPLRRRKWLIIAVAISVTGVITAQVMRAKSIYKSVSILAVEKDTPTTVKLGNVVVESGDSEAIGTRIIELKSRALLEDTTASLKLDQNAAFMETGPAQPESEESRIASSKTNEIPAGSDANNPKSERFAAAVDRLEGGFNVEQIQDTQALRLTFTHTDPAVAAQVLNGIATTFIKRSFDSGTASFKNTSDWLERSTQELKDQVQKADQALADYTRDHDIFTSTDKDSLATDKLTSLHTLVMRAETDRLLKQSLFAEARAGRLDQLPDSFTDAKTAELKKKRDELLGNKATLELKFGPKNPKVVEVTQSIASVEEQIAENKTQLGEKLKADYERAVRDEAELVAAFNRAKSEAVEQNEAAIQYNILKKDVVTANSLYQDFLQRTNQAKFEVAQQRPRLRVIDPARPPKSPIGPQRLRTIILSFVLSLAAGLGLAVLLEYLDNTIKTSSDIHRYADLPALGVIPAIDFGHSARLSNRRKRERNLIAASGSGLPAQVTKESNGAKLIAYDSHSTAAEAYRMLRTSVLLSAVGGPPKTLLFTSAQSGEGKTTTAINVGISLAQLGASVLIMDADLRKPGTHRAFGVDGANGLSTYLSSDVKVDGLIQELPVANLFLLPSGRIPPNPAEMISSTRMRELIQELSNRFDHVLIDSPPLVHVTDPVILSTLVDGVLLVAQGNKSTRNTLRRSREDLLAAGATIYGVVLNNVDPRLDGYDAYYDYSYRSPDSETNGGHPQNGNRPS